MRTKNLFVFLMGVGMFLFACNFLQPQPINVEPAPTIQASQPTPTEAPPTAQVTTVSTATKSSALPIEINSGFPLAIPRTQHTATLLPNGKILLVGGNLEPDDFVADEELLNPMTGSTSWAAPLHTLRVGHSATLLQDGRVLVVGGYNLPQQWLSDAEIYDPSADTWTVSSPHYPHGTAHTATLMKDGRVLVVGGCIGNGVCTERVEIFDPQTGTWTDAASLQSDRASQTAQLLDDGRILIAGGSRASGDLPTDGTAVIYDPQTNTWGSAGSMLTPRYLAESVKLSNGQVLVAGGVIINSSQSISNSAEIYDPGSNTWKSASDLAESRYAFVLTALPNGQIIAISGSHDWDCCWTENSFVREIELYDPMLDTWRVVGNLPRPSAFATGLPLGNGRIWIGGGQSGASGKTFLTDTWLIVISKP